MEDQESPNPSPSLQFISYYLDDLSFWYIWHCLVAFSFRLFLLHLLSVSVLKYSTSKKKKNQSFTKAAFSAEELLWHTTGNYYELLLSCCYIPLQILAQNITSRCKEMSCRWTTWLSYCRTGQDHSDSPLPFLVFEVSVLVEVTCHMSWNNDLL